MSTQKHKNPSYFVNCKLSIANLCFFIALTVLPNIMLNAQRELTPDQKPFPNCPYEYDLDRLTTDPVKGPVKSIIQTSNADSIYQWRKPHNIIIQGKQLNSSYDTSGRLCSFTEYEVSVKDTASYTVSRSTPLPFLQQSTDQFYLKKIKVYTFQDGLLIRKKDENWLYKFEFDRHRNLSAVYSFLYKRLVDEEHLSFNQFNKPVLDESYSYGFDFTHKDPSTMTKAEKEKFRSTTDAFDYDDAGHLIAHKMNNNGKVYWMDYFKYDSVGNLILEGRCEDFKGNVNSCKCKKFHATQGFEYDQQHRRTREYSIGDWKPNGWDDYYEYDDQGRKIRKYGYDILKKQRTLSSDIYFTYDSLDHLIRKEAVVGYFISDFFYFKYPRVDMGEWPPKVKIEEWQYDTYGNLVSHKVELKNGQVYEIRIQYEYDTYGNWVKKTMFRVYSDKGKETLQTLARRIEYYN